MTGFECLKFIAEGKSRIVSFIFLSSRLPNVYKIYIHICLDVFQIVTFCFRQQQLYSDLIYFGRCTHTIDFHLSITIFENVEYAFVCRFISFLFYFILFERTSLLNSMQLYSVPQNQTMANLNKRCNKGMMIVDGCSKLV